MLKAACNPPTFTLPSAATFTYIDNTANTQFTIGEITTTPTDCRTVMEYKVSGFTAISANFDTTALSTSMTAPKLTVNKFTQESVRRQNHDGYLYLKVQGGPAFETTGQKFDFKIYI
jgi:hypothetical protein